MANLKELTLVVFGVLATSASASALRSQQISSTNLVASNSAQQAASAASTQSTTAYNSASVNPLAAYYGGYGLAAVPTSNVQYYSDTQQAQSASSSSTGQTVQYSNVGDGLGNSALNYAESDYNNQAAESSASGQTTAYNAASGLGGSSVDYYNTQYAQQQAAASSTANSLAYQQVLVNPYAYAGLGYGYPTIAYKMMPPVQRLF